MTGDEIIVLPGRHHFRFEGSDTTTPHGRLMLIVLVASPNSSVNRSDERWKAGVKFGRPQIAHILPASRRAETTR
jgi:hypothetical protein